MIAISHILHRELEIEKIVVSEFLFYLTEVQHTYTDII